MILWAALLLMMSGCSEQQFDYRSNIVVKMRCLSEIKDGQTTVLLKSCVPDSGFVIR